MNKGIAGSAGYGVGKVVIISDAKPEYENRTMQLQHLQKRHMPWQRP